MVIICRNSKDKNVTSKTQKSILDFIRVSSLVQLDFKHLKGRDKSFITSDSLRTKVDTKQKLNKCLSNSVTFQDRLRWNPICDAPEGLTGNSINRYLETNQNMVLFLSAPFSEMSHELVPFREKYGETGKRETVPFL
jgi:hypothetical protein